LCVLSQAGCAPTYPKGMVNEAIVQLCREEYGVEVKVEITGGTIGVYIPIEGLFDPTLNISKEAAEKINNAILSVSRVTLSTDAPIEFYIVIAQDPMLPEIEVVLIRHVTDLKMLHYDQISRGEFQKRMVVAGKLTPQAQKEKVLRSVFRKLNISDADRLITEYLQTSEAVSIGDIGYWQDTFYIKEIHMGEFLALQIADRVKARFMSEEALKDDFKLNFIRGKYAEEGGKKFFRFDFNAAPLAGEGKEADVDADARLYDMTLETAAEVFRGYKFRDFRNIEIVNTNNNRVLYATAEELEDFRKKRIEKKEFRQWYR